MLTIISEIWNFYFKNKKQKKKKRIEFLSLVLTIDNKVVMIINVVSF